MRIRETITDLYRHFDINDNLLYVGVSQSAIERCLQHFEKSKWAKDVVKMTIEKFPSREEALIAEKRAIQTENPRHNIKSNLNIPKRAYLAKAIIVQALKDKYISTSDYVYYLDLIRFYSIHSLEENQEELLNKVHSRIESKVKLSNWQ